MTSVALGPTGEGPADARRVPAFDLWLALLAGDRVWIDEDDAPDTLARVAAAIEVLALAVVATRLWLVLPDRLELVELAGVAWAAAAVGTACAVVLARRPVTVLAGRRDAPADITWRVVWRGVAFLALVASMATLLPSWRSLGAWPLGVVAGADILMSTRTLGIDAQPWVWWRRFLVSPIHLGAVGAVTATLVATWADGSASEVVSLYLALQVGAVTACATVAALQRLDAALERDGDAIRHEIVERERRHRAHWLHDDVLSEIRLTSLRFQAGGMGADDVIRELGELDHRLRLRQVDELFAGGSARLADILQPHVRRAQALGVDVVAVPSYDAAGRLVDEQTGRLFARAVSVLTSNALNAGTTTLGFDVRVAGPLVELHVTDDAGGFRSEDIPAGRGLDQLAAQIGRSNLWVTPMPGGSTVSVRLRATSTAGSA